MRPIIEDTAVSRTLRRESSLIGLHMNMPVVGTRTVDSSMPHSIDISIVSLFCSHSKAETWGTSCREHV